MHQVYGLTPDQVDEMMDLSVKYFQDFRGMSFLLGVGEGDSPVYSGMMAAMHVEDAPAFLENYHAYFAELHELVGDAEGSFFANMTAEKVQLDGVETLKISMPLDDMQGFMPSPVELGAIMEKFYGPDGVTSYMAAVDDHTLLMSYTGPEMLRKALGSSGESTPQLSNNAGINATAGQLPAGALAVGYWSPSGTIAFANRTMGIFQGEAAGFQLPPCPDVPPAGWTMTTTSPSAVQFDTLLPADTVVGFGSYIKTLASGLMGAGQSGER
jgi:hypothetical protein